MNTKEEGEERKGEFESNLEEAKRGDVTAQRMIGYAYYFGEGVEKDHEKAFEWYMKAAEQGDAVDQRMIGYAYYFGEGVEQDYEKADEWYKKSKEWGDPDAQKILEEEDDISSMENAENFEIEKLSGDELKPLIIKTFESIPNNSCRYDQLETKVLKYLGSTLRGNKRQQIANRIKRAAGHLQSAGVLQKYKNPGKNSNKRIRLTKNYTDKLPGLKKAWTRQSRSSTKRDFEGSINTGTPNAGTPNEPEEKDRERVADNTPSYKSIKVPDLPEPYDFHEHENLFSGDDIEEEFDHDDETLGKLDVLTGNAGESNTRDNEGDAATSLGQKAELDSNAILPYLVDSLSSMPGVLANHQSGKIIVFLHQDEFHDIKIYLEIKGGYLVAESFFPPKVSMLERLLEISGSADFSCKFGKENMRYVVRRNCEIKQRTADDIYQSILEVMSDVRQVNDVLMGEE